LSDNTFVIGGCRSGKSRHALELADAVGGKKAFIATCIPQDAEMRHRVRCHQAERGVEWTAVEAPLDLPGVLTRSAREADVVLADCLTLWVSNLLMSDEADDVVIDACDRLVQAMAAAPCPVIVVSNEVGTGIVPENRLARRYRDEVGRVNQQVAACADRVVWMVAGIPVTIKPREQH
jgi:adenosylcobinamide kinase / adenosylcobinamide-phosphate guanylyltransferase